MIEAQLTIAGLVALTTDVVKPCQKRRGVGCKCANLVPNRIGTVPFIWLIRRKGTRAFGPGFSKA